MINKINKKDKITITKVKTKKDWEELYCFFDSLPIEEQDEFNNL